MNGSQPRKGRIQTVLGLIDPAGLGPTLMHEHLLIDLVPPRLDEDADHDETEIDLCNCWKIAYGQMPSLKNYRLDQKEVAVEELIGMREAGGAAIVDLTVGGLKPDPAGLAQISREAGVPVVMGCGHYVHEYQDPANASRSIDDFAQEMIGQITEGAWGTQVRAGMIGEIGCQSPWTELEKRVVHGALIAQQATGAALNIHPGRHPDQPQEVVDTIRRLGFPVERVIISHIDRTIFDDARLLRLADSGCVIEFDLFGWEQSAYPMSDIDMPNDGARLRMARTLFDRGHAERVLISHDICTRTRLGRYGGHGYQHIFANIVPRMLRRGFTQDEIDTLLIHNPRRLLAFV
ncbi:phosphotriesterase [Paraburkholderia sabiae]|uniref:Aryldialkylphosphatase n=1 Tax=Paraburkholderia sabiae TaxID=273251 RepID=A0ABU9QL63_9BURK|nr:aryldialkylphosphatase [Paraburkholderia sabiae]WJZ77348.1 aryldialkylphosphatase [Paraburkholderia sabiae]CAD6547716.1 Phosphotriesterase homology protein [Paraburkholderia sabiae]